jgi:hypothetical protein
MGHKLRLSSALMDTGEPSHWYKFLQVVVAPAPHLHDVEADVDHPQGSCQGVTDIGLACRCGGERAAG